MSQLPRYFILIVLGLLLLPLPACKEKEPPPDRPKVTRPPLPDIPKKPN